MTAATIESAEAARWTAHSWVDKYSPDQVKWAEKRIRDGRSLSQRILVSLRGEPRLEGVTLREFFASPEDGTVQCPGNLLVGAGLTNLFSLWFGQTGTAINPLRTGGSSGAAVCGVGATNTAATVADVHLGADGGSAYYQGCDSSFPTFANVSGVVTATLQSTFAAGVGNFAWNEWCWATGAGTVTAGATLASVYATGASYAMVNHKIPASSLGTKGSGAAWVFTTTINIA